MDVLKEGDGVTFPRMGQKITCNFESHLKNGKMLEHIRSGGLAVGDDGWCNDLWETVMKMSKGQRAIFTIHDKEGGDDWIGVIPPNSNVVIDIEILENFDLE